MVQIESDEPDGGSAAVSASSKGVAVPIRCLDEVDLPAPVSFIKMEVDGFELEVLRGASHLLEEDRPVIFGEFNQVWLDIRDEDPGPLLHSIWETGYRISAVTMHRSRAWMAPDRVVLREIEPPFTRVDSDLLLVPRT
jgi:hypothetical protein